jgi:hypothetical protein
LGEQKIIFSNKKVFFGGKDPLIKKIHGQGGFSQQTLVAQLVERRNF